MVHILSANNVKGGVTKTTTTINLGAGLARKGKKTLLVDMDPQSNATYTLTDLDIEGRDNTLYEVIIEDVPMQKVITSTRVANLDIAPGTIDLSSADLLLASKAGREWILQRALEPVQDNYDYIIIDTPPNLNLLSVNSLSACTGFIIPIALTLYAMLGIRMLEDTLAELRKNLRIQIPLIGVVAALRENTAESATRLADVRSYFGDKVFETVIPRNVKVDEANDRMVLYDYAPQSKGALAYQQLVEEVIARVE